MWNPLDEPTCIPELTQLNNAMRLRYPKPTLELYNEYWAKLLNSSIQERIKARTLGGEEFIKRMRTWRIHSLPIQGLEQKIKKELFVLKSMYKETIGPYEKADEVLSLVERFVKNSPTYLRAIPTMLGYPKFKYLYGCCGLNVPSIPAIGFSECLCKTYRDLRIQVVHLRTENEIQAIQPHIENMLGLLKLWKEQETDAHTKYMNLFKTIWNQATRPLLVL